MKPFKEGDKVFSWKYGLGEVTEVNGEGFNYPVSVVFVNNLYALYTSNGRYLALNNITEDDRNIMHIGDKE